MSYQRKTIIMKNRAEVHEYHAPHIGRHDKRRSRADPTPEEQKKVNQRRRERQLRWLLNTNFEDGTDAFVTFGFPKDQRPRTISEMQREARLLCRRLRKEYKNFGFTLKYVYTIEVGPRGARHIHMVLSEVNALLLYACWPYGVINIQPLRTHGEYSDLAAYMTKYWQKTEDTAEATGEKLGGKSYYGSRNLEKPLIIQETIRESELSKDPPKLDGWIMGTVNEGVSDLTQRPYREVRYIRDRMKPAKLPKKKSLFARAKEAGGKLTERLRRLLKRRGGD
jgi:hypothetical protein